MKNSFPAHMASSSLWQILIDAADAENRLNTRQAISLIRKLIAGFRAAGLKPGDAVCVHAFNSILYPILYFGIIGAGGVFVGSNPAYKTLELSHLLSITEPKFFVVEEELTSNVISTVQDLIPRTKTFVLSTRIDELNPHGCRSLHELLQHGEHGWIRIDDMETAKLTIAVLQSTSGTTGLPKAAATSHYALVAAGVAMQEPGQRQYEITRLISLPLFHSFGASFVHLAAFHYGETTYIMRKFNAERFVSILHKFGIKEIAVVPAMMASIVNQRTSPLVLQSLRRTWCAGASLPPSLRKALYELSRGEAIISQVWGMTEFGRITSSGWDDQDDGGSVGRLLPNTEARQVASRGQNRALVNDTTELWTGKVLRSSTRVIEVNFRSVDHQ
jgi:4-coumarate--CoA ligase